MTQSATSPSAQRSSAESDHALANALAWFGSIREMVEALELANAAADDARGQDYDPGTAPEDAERTIHESVLSVEVRGGWHCVGGDDPVPAEFRRALRRHAPM